MRRLSLALALAGCSPAAPAAVSPPLPVIVPPPSSVPVATPSQPAPLVPVFQSHLPGVPLSALLFRWSPGGEALLVADADTVQVRDGRTGQVRAERHYRDIATADWSPRGDTVAVLCSGTLHLWSMRDDTVTDLPAAAGANALGGYPAGGWVHLVWTRDGAHLLATHYAGFLYWDIAQRLAHGITDGRANGASSFAWSADGRTIAATAHDGTALLLDAGTEATRAVVHEDGAADAAVRAVAWSDDGKSLAVAGDSGVVRLIDPGSGKVLQRSPDLHFAVGQLAWDGEGKRLAVYSASDSTGSAMSGRLVFWEPATNTARVVKNSDVHTMSGGPELRWTPSGDRLLVQVPGLPFVHGAIVDALAGSVVVPRFDGVLDPTLVRALTFSGTEDPPSIVAVATKKPLVTFLHDRDPAYYSLDVGGTSALWSDGHALLGVDVTSARLLRRLTTDDSQALSPDGRLVARVHRGAITVEDLASGATAGPTISVPDVDVGPHVVAWSPRGTYLTAFLQHADKHSLALFDAKTGARAATIPMVTSIDHVQWSPDETAISMSPAGKEDGNVCHVFAIPRGTERFVSKGQGRWDAGLFSADGERLLFGADGSWTPFVVNAKTGARVGTLGGPLLSGWAPRARRLATRLQDRTACVWDEPTKACVAPLGLRGSHENGIQGLQSNLALRWTPGGTKLARDPDSAEVELYDAGTGALVGTRAHSPTFRVTWLDDDHFIVELADLWLVRASDGATVRVARSDGDAPSILVLAPDGTYDGDPGASDRLLFREGNDVVAAPLHPASDARDRRRAGLWASVLGSPP